MLFIEIGNSVVLNMPVYINNNRWNACFMWTRFIKPKNISAWLCNDVIVVLYGPELKGGYEMCIVRKRQIAEVD